MIVFFSHTKYASFTEAELLADQSKAAGRSLHGLVKELFVTFCKIAKNEYSANCSDIALCFS